MSEVTLYGQLIRTASRLGFQHARCPRCCGGCWAGAGIVCKRCTGTGRDESPSAIREAAEDQLVELGYRLRWTLTEGAVHLQLAGVEEHWHLDRLAHNARACLALEVFIWAKGVEGPAPC